MAGIHSGRIYTYRDDGELRWRYRHEHDMEDLRGIVTTRNLAIYDDKIYLTTFDAHVVALNARSGRSCVFGEHRGPGPPAAQPGVRLYPTTR